LLLTSTALDDRLAEVIEQSLNDYTTDQRGDVGSLLRLEAVDCVNKLLSHPRDFFSSGEFFRRLVVSVARLAAEKLDKVRFHAWLCLQTVWDRASEFPTRAR
jgi:tubulin-specific chaperone D